jgi:hypothetical protein
MTLEHTITQNSILSQMPGWWASYQLSMRLRSCGSDRNEQTVHLLDR